MTHSKTTAGAGGGQPPAPALGAVADEIAREQTRMDGVLAGIRRANAALVRMGQPPIAFDMTNPVHERIFRLGLHRRGVR